MRLSIHTQLDYRFDEPCDVLLQIESAALPEQPIESTKLTLSPVDDFARVAAQDGVGERIWMRVGQQLVVDYRATVRIERPLADCRELAIAPLHSLPAEAVQYLMPSRYCPSDKFKPFVDAQFGAVEGGAKIAAMRDWIAGNFAYVPGSSDCDTTALDSFVKHQGICRDYAHVLIALARASDIPARIASVYAPGVDPPDFHAVAEVFLGDSWHLIDSTGMATAGEMAKIGIGRDAGDVAFLTAFGTATMNSQHVSVEPV